MRRLHRRLPDSESSFLDDILFLCVQKCNVCAGQSAETIDIGIDSGIFSLDFQFDVTVIQIPDPARQLLLLGTHFGAKTQANALYAPGKDKPPTCQHRTFLLPFSISDPPLTSSVHLSTPFGEGNVRDLTMFHEKRRSGQVGFGHRLD